MDIPPRPISRRSALGMLGATATAATWSMALPAGAASASADIAGADPSAAGPDTDPAAAESGANPPVQLLLNGSRPSTGTFAFPGEVDTVVFDNGLVRFTFGRDDAAGGIVTGWADTSITATSVVVDGVELGHNLNGVEPRDPDRQHSFYVDAGGGRTRLVCSQVKVLRVTPELAEVAFVDTTSTPLRHEHHLIMRRGRRGIYGYDILTAIADTSINEVRMNARWDRSILDHAYNWERGAGIQPTYAYLATQERVQDETWRVDGVNNPDLPSPENNSGNLAPGTVYTKYNWSLYHHENPMFGHFGHGFGAWFTPLGGVTDQTLCAFYGVGPNHQDLAIHQDALILNYFGANHYGLPSYPLSAGYRRLYGPWFTYVTVGDPADPDAMIAAAAHTARTEIAENRGGSAWVHDALYPEPAQRTTVKGRLRIADGRPADGFWIVLSTQDVADVYTIHEPTYFVKTAEDGTFSLPGVPPAWAPGTTNPSTYTLYAFAGKGSVTEQYKQTGITVGGETTNLGTITWAPTSRTTFLWQIGRADRMTGEFALATNVVERTNPRSYEKPAAVPGDLSFVIGQSWEPEDWHYAQTNEGTWTIVFPLDRSYAGTAFLTVGSALQQGNAPVVAVNGNTADISGTLPANNDSTIARQADRSGFPRTVTLSFPASLLQVGTNTVTLTRGAGSAAGNGLGWDTFVMEVDEPVAPAAAALAGKVTGVHGPASARIVTVTVTNNGSGAAGDVRLDGFVVTGVEDGGTLHPSIGGRDPNRFPVPVAASILPHGSASVDVQLDLTGATDMTSFDVVATISANGGRARARISASKLQAM